MIRNVVLHINNEQPLLADIFDVPAAGDVGLRCTNLRLMNGKRPVFADDSNSMFFFPYLHIRFVEIPPVAMAGTDIDMPVGVGVAGQLDGPPVDEPEADLEIDEDFLRRIREV